MILFYLYHRVLENSQNQVAKIVFILNLPALLCEQNWNSIFQKAVATWNFYALGQNAKVKPSEDISTIRRTTCGRVEDLQVLEIVFRDCKGRLSKGAWMAEDGIRLSSWAEWSLPTQLPTHACNKVRHPELDEGTTRISAMHVIVMHAIRVPIT